MKCKNCGEEISDNAKFCLNCGEKIEEIDDDDLFDELEEKKQEEKKEEKHTNIIVKIFSVIFELLASICGKIGYKVSLLFAILGSAIYFGIKKLPFIKTWMGETRYTNVLLTLNKVYIGAFIITGILTLFGLFKARGLRRLLSFVGLVVSIIGLIYYMMVFNGKIA